MLAWIKKHLITITAFAFVLIITSGAVIYANAGTYENSSIATDNISIITTTPFPIAMITPEPIVSICPTVVPETEVIIPSVAMEITSKTEEEDISEIDDSMKEDPLWVLTDDGEKYRYNELAKFFDLSVNDVKILVEAYYWYSNEEFNGYWYDVDKEEKTIYDWIIEAAKQFGYKYNDMIDFLITGYSDGSLDATSFWLDTDGYPDEELFMNPDEESLENDSSKYDASCDNGESDGSNNDDGNSEYENTEKPFSYNGLVLNLGDKVQYSPDDYIYYGGTIQAIKGSMVMVTWEMKGDMYTGPIDKLTDEDKKSISDDMFDQYDLPSDRLWYDAEDMEKIDNNSW